MHVPNLIAVSIYFLGNVLTIGAQTCYWPDRSIETSHIPCQAAASGKASACCPYWDICLDNGLCLPQVGNEVIWRGTCTDQSWQSGDCPQYCQDGKLFNASMRITRAFLYSCSLASCPSRNHILHKTNQHSYFRLLVHTSYGVTIFPFQGDSSFCCGPGNSSSGACTYKTQGSFAPFPVHAGRVIFNRTSGSTSPNNSDTSTVTISSAAASSTIATLSSDSTVCHNMPSSSNKPTKVGVGVGVPFGLAFFGALGLLWRQRVRELGARREAHDLGEKYDALMKEKRGNLTSAEYYMHKLGHEQSKPNEIDGRSIYEAEGRTR